MSNEPTPQQIENNLHLIPELGILQSISDRTGRAFALRGGILRNIYLQFDEWAGHETSLFNFIDAFSDIDLIVEKDADSEPIGRAIAASVPCAGFFHWEFRSWARVQREAASFSIIPVDTFALWIGRQSSARESFEWGTIHSETPERRFASSVREQDLGEWLLRVDQPTAIGTLLRLARYSLQHQYEGSDIGWIIKRIQAEGLSRSGRDSYQEPSKFSDRRLEMSAAKLLFSAKDVTQAVQIIDATRRALEGQSWLKGQFMLGFGQQLLERLPEFGAIFSRKARLGPALLEVATGKPDSASRSRFPWTRINLDGRGAEDGCCQHRDFAWGAAIVAWRSWDSVGSFQPGGRSSEQLAAVARFTVDHEQAHGGDSPAEDQSPAPRYWALPGIIRGGVATTARLDHGYIRQCVPAIDSFELGAVRADDTELEN